MFEFSKLCKEFESLTVLERGVIMTGKSAEIFAKLRKLNMPGVDPVQTLAGFILGSVVADGRVNEQEYLLIYPALIHTFGDDFDFESIKQSFKDDRDGRNAVKEYTQEMLSLISHQVFPRMAKEMVEMKGIEPLTPCLQGRCSPN